MYFTAVRVGIVVVLASGLGQAAADHAADGEEHDVLPRLVGAEIVGVTVVAAHHEGSDQDRDDGGDVAEEFCRLQGRRRLGRQATRVLSIDVGACAVTGGGIGRTGDPVTSGALAVRPWA
ncbi:hypothetical protein [Streptomyces sp. NPDC055109]